MYERLPISPYVSWGNENIDTIYPTMEREFERVWTSRPFNLDLTRHQILIAVDCANDDYRSACLVLYRDLEDGQFYEVNGSHCSCHGYEGQWRPELASLEELEQRPRYFGKSYSVKPGVETSIRLKLTSILRAVAEEKEQTRQYVQQKINDFGNQERR